MSSVGKDIIRSGGVKAVGKIVFTGNLIAGDKVTVNGVEFTCVASGATGEVQFNVDSSLALSLASLNTKLNACTDPLVSRFTYTVTDTNTAITATADNYGTADNSVVLASTHSTVVVTQPTGGLALRYVSLGHQHTQINFGTAVTREIYLQDGYEGQRKTIAMIGAGTANLKGDNLPGSTVNYALNGDDVLDLVFAGGKWRLVMNDGAVAS